MSVEEKNDATILGNELYDIVDDDDEVEDVQQVECEGHEADEEDLQLWYVLRLLYCIGNSVGMKKGMKNRGMFS